MTSDQLRQALNELDGQRDLRVVFETARDCVIHSALLIPEEADSMVKVTDGARVFMLDAHRVAWLVIGTDAANEIKRG